MVRRHNRFLSGPLSTGQDMISSGHPLSDQLEDRIRVVQAKWAMLKEEAGKRRVTLESATDAYLFFSDCNETDSVIKEYITLAKSKVNSCLWRILFSLMILFLGLWPRQVDRPVPPTETQVPAGQDPVHRGGCGQSGRGR